MSVDLYSIPLLQFPMTVGNNEDWIDSWSYMDASNAPIALPSITYVLQLRKTADGAVLYVMASNVPSFGGIASMGAIVIGGTGGNVLALNILAATMRHVGVGTYVFEVQGIDGTRKRTIATGPVTVIEGIVR